MLLLICDYAQIEARVLAWYAGQQDLLNDFAAGKDIYAKFATMLYQTPIRKSKDTDSKQVYNYMKIRRGFGKDAILGLGYGMGANTFYENCQENSDLKNKFDFQFIKEAVNTYRTVYNNIPKFWSNIESYFRMVVKYSHLTEQGCKLKFSNNGKGCINLTLPNGRVLFYPHSTIIKETVNHKQNVLAYKYSKLWGGTLTENVVQATSRDIMAESILRLEANGIKVIMHSHDEIISCIPNNEAQSKLKKMIELMCIVPTWATDLPINVEGEISEYYKI